MHLEITEQLIICNQRSIIFLWYYLG